MFNVTSYGAIGDGLTNDTAAIQQTIDAAAAHGVTVLFPPGRYLSGTLILRSHITLHLEKGATLLGSTDHRHYQPVPTDPATPASPPPPWWYAQTRYLALLVAKDASHITLSGQGTIDGQGAPLVAHVKALFDQGLLHQTNESVRPALINFVHCQHLQILDLTLRNSACWTQTYTDCDHLIFRGLTIHGHAYWNNDGIDLCDCSNASISDCHIDAADDGICLKSGAHSCNHIAISNCIIRSFANGIKFGTASAGSFHHVTISNLAITASGHSGIALESVDGGTLQDVLISNITMHNLRHAIFIKLAARNRLKDPNAPVGKLRRIILSNITAQLHPADPDAGDPLAAPPIKFPHNRFPCVISGLPGHPVEDLTLSNILLQTPGGADPAIAHLPLQNLSSIPENQSDYPEYYMHGELPAHGWYVRHARNFTLQNLTVQCLHPDYRPAIVLDDVQSLTLTDPRLDTPSPTIILHNVHQATLRGTNPTHQPENPVQQLAPCTQIVQTN